LLAPISDLQKKEVPCSEEPDEHHEHVHCAHDHCTNHAHIHQHKKRRKHSHDHHEHSHEHSHGAHDHDHHENHWLKAGIGLFWGLGLLILSLVSFNIPLIAYLVLTGLTTLVTLYLGSSIYKSAWNALKQLKWNTASLYAISTLTIVAVSIASLFVPGLPMMFEAAPLVLGFWHLAEGIEHSLVGEITKELDVRDCIPPTVRLKGITERVVSVKTLLPNDIIIVEHGQVIPVDGILTQEALLYTTRIDGSPELKVFKPGDVVKSGMLLADHLPSVELRVSKTYEDSYLSLIAKNINQANSEKAPVELFADKVLKYFIPGLLTVALISGLVIGFMFTPALAIQCVISVLVSACPCALSLITPMAVKIGMKKASDQGVQFKNGKALQAAADIDTVVFDLNGTLTKGQIEVGSLSIIDKKYLPYIALLEAQSEHPVAKVIKSYAQAAATSIDGPLEISAVDKSHHSGVKAMINGELFIIGNQEMLLAQHITHIDKPYDNPENGAVYIAKNGVVIGQIALTDPLREDAAATVKQLQTLGKKVHICTGAHRATAEQYAVLLGIPIKNICANTVGAAANPGEFSKTDYILQLKRKGYKVAMVGDAANDVTAIAQADIGIAVRSSIGDDITEQHAGVVVQKGLLFPIATAFDVAHKTKTNIFQNLLVSLSYNSTITLVAAGLFVALGFALNPALGVALMIIESAIVLGNLYRFKQQQVISAAKMSDKVVDETLQESATARIMRGLDKSSPNPEKQIASQPGVPSKAGAFFDRQVVHISHQQIILENAVLQ
jgi:Cu2+-exporting ATPase